jgi:hypothetical protein
MGVQEEIRRASIILVGQATSVAMTERLAETPDHKWVLRQTKVNISVENVFKGKARGPNITFYYFYPQYGYDGPALNDIGPTTRGIFFLEQDQNVYRSVNDVYKSYIRLLTGSHPGLATGPQKTVEQAIVEASLLPGSQRDLDRKWWPYAIEVAAEHGGWLIGHQKTIQLLGSLYNYPDFRVRTEACLAASRLSAKKLQCLERIPADTGVDPWFDYQMQNQLYEFGLIPRPLQRPAPGVAEVPLTMKRVRTWWPW